MIFRGLCVRAYRMARYKLSAIMSSAHFIDMGCDSRAAIAGITTQKAFSGSDNLRLTLKVDGSSSEKAMPVLAIRVAVFI